MRIEDAWIDDPALRGELSRPKLCVQVDVLPDVTIEPESFAGGWTVGKFGPFVTYKSEDPRATAGDFNVRFRGRFPVVVDIDVFLTRGEEYWSQYCLPLTRARQLVRKYDRGWTLNLSDKDAQHGQMIWVPSEINPPCKYYNKQTKDICGQRPTQIIRVSEVDLAMCAEHTKRHNDRFAAKRTASSR